MMPFKGRNMQRNDSVTLLESKLNLPHMTDAQAATLLFLAMAPEKVAEGNEEALKLKEKFGAAISEGSLEKIRQALTIKLFKIKSAPPVTNNNQSQQSVLDSNFSESEDAISEEEEDVLQCYEIFRLMSIPIPPFLDEYFDQIVKAKRIAVRRDSNGDDLKTFFIYTESNILKEVCELLSPRDVARLYDSIRNDKYMQEIPEDFKEITLSEEKMCSVEGLKEVAFYLLIFNIIQARKISRLYTHQLQNVIETVKAMYESEGDSNISRLQESIMKLERYPVSSHPPGICLIFSMSGDRTGAEIDVLAVKNLFEKIYKYYVILKVNPNKGDVKMVIDKLKAPRNKFYDSLVVWFMGHGSCLSLRVMDGEINRMKEFVEPLTEIKWFNKKPKLFFIQACTSEEGADSAKNGRRASAIEMETDASGLGTGNQWNNKYASFMEFESVNYHADRLIANAANWCANAARNQEGSLWVQTLVDLLKIWGHTESIENVLRKVHYNVNTIALATKDIEWKQTPFYESSLQKEFIFSRDSLAVEDEHIST